MAALNPWGGVAGGMSSQWVGAGGAGLSNGPLAAGNFASGGIAPGGVEIPSAATANQNNYIASHNAMVADPAYRVATGLLNPNDPTAMRDVAQHGAEHAVGTGMVGSGQAGQYTGRLRQYDIERRATLGNQLLTGAYGRQPAPVNPYAQAQLQLEQANAENKRLLSEIQGRYAPSGGFSQGGGGGGGRSAPMMIGGGGGGGGAAPSVVRPWNPSGGGTPAGNDQVAYGQGGGKWNAANQKSQFYKGEYAPGTIYSGSVAGAPTWPTPPPTMSDAEFENLFG